jgi:redox-sensitive bicupin YhaK (pirin superfamily)
VASDLKTAVKINQDANIFVSEISPGQTVDFNLQKGRQGYLLCVEGTVSTSIGDARISMQRHDAAELLGPGLVRISPTEGHSGHMLLVEMELTGGGRTDV